MANYSKYNKNGGLNVQNSTLGDWLTGLFTKKEEPKAPVKTAADASRDAYVQQILAQQKNTEPKTAQQYAQDALNGVGGRYVPASQTVNAMINAQVPVTPVTGGTGGGGGSGSGGGGTAGSAMDAVYSAYAQAQAQQDALYRQQDDLHRQKEELAAKQRDDLKATLLAQNEAAKKQRETVLNATLDTNNQAADKSLREAYIAYMLGKRNMPQELKAMGISGGATETTLADANNTYMNNRFGIEDGRNNANAIARRDYDTGVNSDYVNYMAALSDVENAYANRMFDLLADKNNFLMERANTAASAGRSLADALAKAGKTSTSTSKATTSTPAQSVVGYKIGDNQTVHTSGESLLKELYNLGFTESQAREYLKNAGVM